MARHSIDEALLSAGGPSADEPAALRIGVDNPYEGPKTMLLDAVAAANRCRVVWAKEFGFCTLIGFDADLDAVELLYTSLLVQATSAMQRAGSRKHKDGAARTKAFRQSFLVAYAARIRERLAEATERATEDAAAGRPAEPAGDGGPRAGRCRCRPRTAGCCRYWRPGPRRWTTRLAGCSRSSCRSGCG
ncbi:hypothetical protein KCH_33300 [Kitasatospora cheerisanensis KCTC 2395]|uniref:DUF7168 domain-containing protein n=2 Tax=Kitasatospora cheerisanensis TaxID=81942 RepID=A0A066YTD1_9ACTN|nr:hypothetical protein KCH_33300 [Kitasatospora cheerisanensis KCTC 2395]